MFTGIVQAVGKLAHIETRGDGRRLRIDACGMPLDAVEPGDSIAVNGACMTVTEIDDGGFRVHASAETLAVTTLGGLIVGAAVNLERPLTLATPLGGHLVSGHVDGTGVVTAHTPAGESVRLGVRVPGELTRYIARKCSVCVDGVSLTVNTVDGDAFEVNLVPYTLENTVLGALAPGDKVNIEVDMLARYLEALMRNRAWN